MHDYSSLEPRGLLDPDNPLADILNPILTSLGGADEEDVASGALDTSTLSRSDRATLAIDGELPGPLDSVLRPWGVGLDVSPGDVGALVAGGGLLFKVSEPFASALVDKLVPPRFALLWDDSVIETQGVLETAATKNTLLQVSVGPPKGTRLTLWCTDSDVSFELLEVVSPGGVDAQRKRAIEAAGQGDPLTGFLAGVKGAFGSILATYGALGVAAIAVGGVVLYLWLRPMRPGGG